MQVKSSQVYIVRGWDFPSPRIYKVHIENSIKILGHTYLIPLPEESAIDNNYYAFQWNLSIIGSPK